ARRRAPRPYSGPRPAPAPFRANDELSARLRPPFEYRPAECRPAPCLSRGLTPRRPASSQTALRFSTATVCAFPLSRLALFQCDGLRVSSVTACTFPLRRSARFHCDGSRFHHFFPRAACLSVTSAAPPPLIKANPSRNTTKRLKLRPCPERRGGAPHHQAARNDFLQHRRFFA